MSQHACKLKRSILDGTEEYFEHENLLGTVSLPENFDLRPNCPPVYDQGQEGSCTAHAGCACRAMLEKNPQLDLSRAFLYYEERALEGTTGQDAGASIKDICAATQKRGICPTPDMPYVPGEYKAAPSQTALDTAVRFKIGGSKIVLGVDGVKTALYTRSQPVIIGMTVYASMESDVVAKSGILPMPKLGEQIVGGHAVLIVGWHDNPKPKDNPDDFIDEIIREIEDLTSAASKGYFIVRNSWGADWGQKGYFMMPYEYFERYAYDFWIMEA